MRKIIAGDVFTLRQKTGCNMAEAKHQLLKIAMIEALPDVKSVGDLLEIVAVLVEAY